MFVGSGDAFGHGGRFNTCFHVTGDQINFLLDCGASSIVSLKANQVALNEIQAILITHFHADHFGGVPFLILDARFFSKRTQALTIAGPPGLRDCFEHLMEMSFPGSSKIKQRFGLSLLELEERQPTVIDGLCVTPFLVNHGNTGWPSFAYRIEAEGRTIAYTGDTEWTDALIEAGRNADLFIAEAYFYDKNVKFHLNYVTLVKHLSSIQPKRLVLTHMSEDMLQRVSEIPHEIAEDGNVLEF